VRGNHYDAVVVGSGPNGLAAAITLARQGRSVIVLEAKDTIGGGVRSAELTLPGFVHDPCSAILPLSLASPFFNTLPLEEHGLEWIYPAAELAHPLDDGSVMIVQRSVEATGQTLGEDAEAYRVLMNSVVDDWADIIDDLLGPAPLPPKHPLALTGFGLLAIRPAANIAKSYFKSDRGRALFAGMAAHSMMKLESMVTGAFGLMLGMLAHAVGWPLARGGSQQVANALASYLEELGGEIVTNRNIISMDELPDAQAVFFDLAPKGMLQIAGDRFPERYRSQLESYRHGPGVCKVDWALDGPIPWRAPEVASAATVHLGGTFEEIAASERAVWQGEHSEKPYVLLAQQSLFDPSRAPQGKHTAWAYCHVPHGSQQDVSARIEAQVERFAPGFRDLILARHVRTAQQMEMYNPNYVGGDINGGVQDLRQLFTRPAPRLNPYSTPLKGVYICSSSTPPGGGVHGMCGYHAARSAMRDLF
jgi:phytoene dehydrogenase-like protein